MFGWMLVFFFCLFVEQCICLFPFAGLSVRGIVLEKCAGECMLS